jgi:Skp family chaperone for outer membrane proteins
MRTFSSMKLTVLSPRILAVAPVATLAGTCAAQTNAGAAPPPKPSAATAAKEKAKSGPASPAELQKLIEQLGAQRETMISDYEALSKQLKDATEAQKKQILEKMEAQKKAFAEASSALQRQLADERRKQRAGAAHKR